MQVSIVSGIYSDANADFRTAYPRNMVPVPKESGVSSGYLRPADGLIAWGDAGPGSDRGGINWNNVCYRAMGTKLVSIDNAGAVTVLGEIGGSKQVTFDYSFDRLGVASNDDLYYWDGSTLTQVTDVDLGDCLDFIFIDGYFASTDGESIVTSDLTNPTSFNPLKYGSSELDPDPIVALVKLRNELVALNRYTIESFDNVGGSGFPFRRIDGASIQRGCIGTHANTIFLEQIAFLGGGRNESPAIWIGANGQTRKLSTREVDQEINQYTEAQLSDAVLSSRTDQGHLHLWVALPDFTLVYDAAASQMAKRPVWFKLTSSLTGNGQYRATNPVWCYNRWLVGDPLTSNQGYLDQSISSHWGEVNGWDFSTPIIYNASRGAIFHEIELVGLTGRTAFGDDPTIWTSYSTDGVTFSQEKPIKAGKTGERNKRLVWFNQGIMRNWRIQRFRGTSDAHVSFARLEMKLEGLNA